MKKMIILILLINGILNAQFEKGTISAGSIFSYTSYKFTPDSDAFNLTNIGNRNLNVMMQTLKPTVSYFINESISLDASIGLLSVSIDGDSDESTWIGVGGTKYTKKLFYFGGSIWKENNSDISQTYAGANLGLLKELAQNVFLDIGGTYLFGIGEVDSEYYEGVKNEQTKIDFVIGIKAFFKS